MSLATIRITRQVCLKKFYREHRHGSMRNHSIASASTTGWIVQSLLCCGWPKAWRVGMNNYAAVLAGARTTTHEWTSGFYSFIYRLFGCAAFRTAARIRYTPAHAMDHGCMYARCADFCFDDQ